MSDKMNPEWLVLIQDSKDLGEKRTTALKAHITGQEKDPSNMWVLGGYCVVEHVNEPSEAKLTGSALIGRAPSKEAIELRIKSDAFYTEGVWDPKTLMILPFVSTVRQSL